VKYNFTDKCVPKFNFGTSAEGERWIVVRALADRLPLPR
jgi:hypothetical protein